MNQFKITSMQLMKLLIPVTLRTMLLAVAIVERWLIWEDSRKFQISLFKCKVPGREILRYSLNERENELVTYILGGKSGFTMLHKFTYCACLSLKFTCHILILTWIKSFCTYKPFATLSKYFIRYEPLQLLNVPLSMSTTSEKFWYTTLVKRSWC